MGMGPCEWPLSYVECSNTAALDSLDEETRAAVECSAQEYLWQWSNQIFGLCTETVRPCRKGCADLSTFYATQTPVVGFTYAGESRDGLPTYASWVDYGCGSCASSRCSCEDPATDLRLPGPVAAVLEVLIDGIVLPPSAYRVDNHSILVREDGGVWPNCQDMSLPGGEPGTWQVTYQRGLPVPVGGQVAAGVLAAEMARSLCNDGECQLPQRVQSVSRNGVSMVMLDGFDNLKDGYTGVWIIDSWIASVNRPRRGGSVRSVDMPKTRNRRETWRA